MKSIKHLLISAVFGAFIASGAVHAEDDDGTPVGPPVCTGNGCYQLVCNDSGCSLVPVEDPFPFPDYDQVN